jgi:hypothetical protein
MATIKYFIPEDGDKEEHPNIFMLKKSTQSGFSPRLRDVKDAFPMPGKYHFRFKSPLIPGTDREKGAVAVWMDCVDNDQRVGVWKNSIFAKVTRISMEEEDEDSDDEFEAHRRQAAATNHTQHHHKSPARNAAPAPQPQQQQQHHHHHPANPPTSVASESNLLGVFDEPTPTPRSAPSSGNLLDVPVPSAVSGEGSLLDMDTGASSYPAATGGGGGGVGVGSNDHGASDFFGMTAAAPAPQQQQQQQQQPTQAQMQQQQQQQQQQYMQQTSNGNGNAFNTFSEKNGPFGGLEWK